MEKLLKIICKNIYLRESETHKKYEKEFFFVQWIAQFVNPNLFPLP